MKDMLGTMEYKFENYLGRLLSKVTKRDYNSKSVSVEQYLFLIGR